MYRPCPCASTAEGMEMKISSKDFRVKEGDEVDLGKWPTTVEPVYSRRTTIKSCWRSTLRNY